jgi:lysine/ornithine N-monooxygenase
MLKTITHITNIRQKRNQVNYYYQQKRYMEHDKSNTPHQVFSMDYLQTLYANAVEKNETSMENLDKVISDALINTNKEIQQTTLLLAEVVANEERKSGGFEQQTLTSHNNTGFNHHLKLIMNNENKHLGVENNNQVTPILLQGNTKKYLDKATQTDMEHKINFTPNAPKYTPKIFCNADSSLDSSFI